MKKMRAGRNAQAARWPVWLLLVTPLAMAQTSGMPLAQPPAQSAGSLPATTPTASTPQPAPAATYSAPAPPAARRARVDFHDGLLSVEADNSSLNGILRDVARATGMRITGGVQDERVFGHYGPADLGTVLSALLNGTGSNMLLIAPSSGNPLGMELVLTARQGGPTPPSPMQAPSAPGEEDLPPQFTPRTDNRRPAAAPEYPSAPPPPPPQAAPAAPIPEPATAQPTATEQSPNGVKTPQQIYEQLLKLQQQQKQQAPPQ